MKKIIIAIILILSLLVTLSACGGNPVKKQATVEGSIFGGNSDDRISAEVAFDTKWITSDNNCKYNPNLARFCALLSSDSYFRAKDLAKDRQNRVLFDENKAEEYSMTSFLEAFGFTDAEHFESYLVQDDPTDSDDSVTLNIGHQTVNGKYDVYVVCIRGCFSWQEWCSAFDPGCSDEAYEALTGSHPEWTHREYLKGIDVAANRALGFVQSFISEHNDERLSDCILLTGHSRGGTIANVLGAYYEKESDIRSYTYTFNAVPEVSDENTDKYRTIFNVFDSNDFFCDPFPFENTKFHRFGTDKTISVAQSDDARSDIAELIGRDDYVSVPEEKISEYRTLFAERFPSRDMLCDTATVTYNFDDIDSANAGLEELKSLISTENGLGIEDLCKADDVIKGDDGKYYVAVEYCGLTLLRSYAKILAYGSAAYDGVVKLFAADEKACGIADILVENAAGINGGHLIANSYVVAEKVK